MNLKKKAKDKRKGMQRERNVISSAGGLIATQVMASATTETLKKREKRAGKKKMVHSGTGIPMSACPKLIMKRNNS